jgi:DNA-binding response OmpR family regulator
MMSDTLNIPRPGTQSEPLVHPGAASVAILCDAPPLARLCEAALARLGLAPKRLPGADDALRMLEPAPPRLLIALLVGRDPSLLGLCQTVGLDPAFANTRLVIVQDSARDIDMRRAHALGADAVLALPLDPDALERTVDSLLKTPA